MGPAKILPIRLWIKGPDGTLQILGNPMTASTIPAINKGSRWDPHLLVAMQIMFITAQIRIDWLN